MDDQVRNRLPSTVRCFLSSRYAMVAQGLIQGSFLIGAFFALADDQRATDLIRAGGKLLGIAAGHND